MKDAIEKHEFHRLKGLHKDLAKKIILESLQGYDLQDSLQRYLKNQVYPENHALLKKMVLVEINAIINDIS